MTTVAFLMAFFTAEVQQLRRGHAAEPHRHGRSRCSGRTPTASTYGRPWFSQKIFYFHVPVAEASFLVFIVAAYFARPLPDDAATRSTTRSRAIAMEVTLLFVILTLITGDLWTRPRGACGGSGSRG